MQYLITFAVVLLILIVMSTFFLMLVRSNITRINSRVSENFLSQLEIYDKICEEKFKKLQEMKEEEERLKSNIVVKKEEKEELLPESGTGVSAVIDIPSERYISEEFADGYRYIRNCFQIDQEEALNRALEDLESRDEKTRIIDHMMSGLSFDLVYQISTLNAQEQSSLLKEIFTEKEQEILEGYEKHSTDFSVIAFWDYLKREQERLGKIIEIHTSDRNFSCSQKAKVVMDPEICEGIKVYSGEYLYDYSI